MAEDNTNQPDLETDPSKNNEEVARKLAEQDISGKSNAPSPDFNKHSDDALDALIKEAEQKSSVDDDEAAKEKEAADAAAKKAAEDAVDPEKKAAAEKSAADAAAKTEAEKKKVDEIFKDTPQLPQGASPKSSEAFATVKIKAAQEISARDQKITDLETKVKEMEAKLANPIPDDVQREIEEHRQWRAKLDVEIDPKFKEFDKSVTSAQDFIYAQLKKSPKVTEETIAAIKKHGGPEFVDMGKLLEAIGDSTTQRLVEQKLADIEMTKFQKQQAVDAAKQNIKQYMQDREKAMVSVGKEHNQKTEARVKEISGQMGWLKEKQAPAGADDATKKSIAAYNEFVKETNSYIRAALEDDSPEMRAVMVAGMAQLLYTQREEAASKARITQLEKELKEATDTIAKFKGASVSRLRESAVPPGGRTPVKKDDGYGFGKSSGDALDEIAKGIQEERARAAGAGA